MFLLFFQILRVLHIAVIPPPKAKLTAKNIHVVFTMFFIVCLPKAISESKKAVSTLNMKLINAFGLKKSIASAYNAPVTAERESLKWLGFMCKSFEVM